MSVAPLRPFPRLAGVLLCYAALAVLSPTGAGAFTMQTFDYSSLPILGGADPSFLPDVTVEFAYDETCITSSCDLAVTLTYHDSGGLTTIGQTLAGVAFATRSNGGALPLDVDLTTSTAIATSLVGAGADDALADFGGGPNSNVDVSGHWGFRPDLVSSGSLAPNLLSSVGDAYPDTSALGNPHLFAGTISSVEQNPPDGTPFSIVDPNTCTGPPGTSTCGALHGGFQDMQNRAWVQNEILVTLRYDGSAGPLTDIGDVNPLFGTEGRPLPEPGTGLLLGLALVSVAAIRRR